MRRDAMNQIKTVTAIAPAVVTGNSAQASSIIDTQGFSSLTFAIALGTLADSDATFAVTMEHGDAADLSDAAAPAATDLVGTTTLASFQFDDDGETRKIGYIGSKRYVRLTITPSNNSDNAPMACVAILSNPHLAPTANPSQ